jgi:nucleoside-diphosphate-sugar epimerase
MPVLVTGGSGHLGANLVRRLLDEGVAVRALVRQGSDNSALDGLTVERVYGDLRDPAAMATAVAGCERVYHCAAKLSTVGGGERDIYDCNVIGTRNLLAAALAARVKRVVVTGSFSAVGHHPDRAQNEEDPFYPFGHALAYEKTKVLVEHETLRAVARGLDAVVATSCAIIGPADYKPSRMGRTLLDFANGKLHAYIGGGFEFVAARDIVEGHLLAMEKGRTGEKYIFASGYVTVDELMDHYEHVTGQRRPRLRLPGPLMLGIAEVTSPLLTRFFPDFPQRLTPGAVRLLRLGRRADTSKAQRELGFRPTPIADAIRDAYVDFVRRGLVARPNPSLAPYTERRSAEAARPSPPSPPPTRGGNGRSSTGARA